MNWISMAWGAAKGFALMTFGFILGMLFMRENYLGIIEQLLRERTRESHNRGWK